MVVSDSCARVHVCARLAIRKRFMFKGGRMKRETGHVVLVLLASAVGFNAHAMTEGRARAVAVGLGAAAYAGAAAGCVLAASDYCVPGFGGVPEACAAGILVGGLADIACEWFTPERKLRCARRDMEIVRQHPIVQLHLEDSNFVARAIRANPRTLEDSDTPLLDAVSELQTIHAQAERARGYLEQLSGMNEPPDDRGALSREFRSADIAVRRISGMLFEIKRYPDYNREQERSGLLVSLRNMIGV